MEKLEPTVDKRCGTESGYRRHRRSNEHKCQPCKDAHNIHRRATYNPEVNRKHAKKYKESHFEIVRERQKKYTKRLDPEVKAARKEARQAVVNSPEAVAVRKKKASEGQKRWRASNKEKVAALARVYGKKNRDKLREKDRQRRASNPEKYKKQNQEYYKKNKEKIDKKKKEWLLKNPHHRSEVDRRRRARKANNGYEKYTWQEVIQTYGSNCYLCLKPIDLTAERQTGRPGWEEGLHIDHFVPIVKGGPDTLANVRPTHGRCNLSKGSQILLATA